MEHHHNSESSALSVSSVLTGLAVGGAVIGAGIILAPHVLPALGVGTTTTMADSMWAFHNYEASAELAISKAGIGIAGNINHLLAAVPFIGEKLAADGILNAAASGAIGIGGMLLGNFIAEREDGTKAIKWGNVIKYAAIATSALISMPMLLSGLSLGITYIAMFIGQRAITDGAVNLLTLTIGVSGAKMGSTFLGLSGLSAAVPHLLTCGVGLLPAALSFQRWRSDQKHEQEWERLQEEYLQNLQKYSDGSVRMSLASAVPTSLGKPCRALITLRHDDGTPLTADELAVTHTEKIHLFVTDTSLKDYQHIHPQPTATPGVFEFSFTPQTGHHYSAWADFTVGSTGRSHQLKADIPCASGRHVPARIHTNLHAKQAGLQFDWFNESLLEQGKPDLVEIKIRDANGNPVTDLEPVMGAYAHLVGFSADGNSLIHCHPLDAEPTDPQQRGGPNLRFHIQPDHAGPTQFYLQIKRNGEEIFVPFGQQIKPPQQMAERVMLSSHQHGAVGHAH